ncbi:MAG: excalibur calcium-binding domain-containing protein [Methylococcales bacterium]|nr:excalibur calcium-binding domain-containing protein [Methylococcales bacterium]
MGWYGNYKYKQGRFVATSTGSSIEDNELTEPSINRNYECDGRTYCSQMTSCAEATFFINNCSGTKMDGDNDGIPCESQWCQ